MVARGILNASEGQSRGAEGRDARAERKRKRKREKARKGHGNRPNSLMEKQGVPKFTQVREQWSHRTLSNARRRLRQIITYFMTFLHRPFNLPTKNRGRGGQREIRKWNHTLITSTSRTPFLYKAYVRGAREGQFAISRTRIAYLSGQLITLWHSIKKFTCT